MNGVRPAGGAEPARGSDEEAVARALAALCEPAPADFAARVLSAAGIAADRYDTYTAVDTAAGPLYVAGRSGTVTGAVLARAVADAADFEALHRSRTGRSAIRGTTTVPGVRTALRTGRSARLRLDLGHLEPRARAVLATVGSVPRGQLRPLSWLAREAALTDPGFVREVLAANPVHVLVPAHRITDEQGVPCDDGHGRPAGDALRRAEAIDTERVAALARQRTLFLGSDTTHIYCHPTCAHARRITERHRVPFQSAGQARDAGYRPCKSCRPAAA